MEGREEAKFKEEEQVEEIQAESKPKEESKEDKALSR